MSPGKHKEDRIRRHRPDKTVTERKPDRNQFVVDLTKGVIVCNHCRRMSFLPINADTHVYDKTMTPQNRAYIDTFKKAHIHRLPVSNNTTRPGIPLKDDENGQG